jgi:hypothetical protein
MRMPWSQLIGEEIMSFYHRDISRFDCKGAGKGTRRERSAIMLKLMKRKTKMQHMIAICSRSMHYTHLWYRSQKIYLTPPCHSDPSQIVYNQVVRMKKP